MPDASFAGPLLVIAALLASFQTLLALVPSYLVASLCATVPLRELRGAPWYERARGAWPLQTLFGFAYLVTLIATFIIQSFVWRDHGVPVAVAAAVSSALTTILVMTMLARPFRRTLHGTTPTWRSVFHAATFTWLAQWQVVPIMLLGLALAPDRFNAAAGGLLVAELVIAFVLIFGGSGWLLRCLGVAEPPSPALRHIVDRAVERASIPPPHVFEIDIPGPNAWAYPATGSVYVARRLLTDLDADELESVMLHEFGHLRESRGTVAVRLLAIPLTCVASLARPLIGSFGLVEFLAILVLLVLAMRLLTRFAFRLEIKADAYTKETVVDGATYARALEKIYRAGLIPAVLGASSPTHPNLYDRMLAAGITPDFERPAAPSPRYAILSKALFCSLMIMAWSVTHVAIVDGIRFRSKPASPIRSSSPPPFETSR